MKRIALLCIGLFFSALAMAQTNPAKKAVHGLIKEKSTQTAMPYVSITVKNENAKIVAGSISDEKGAFVLDSIPTGNLTIEFSFMGYQAVSRPLQITALSSRINLGTIYLEPDPKLLQEVAITGERPTISLQIDKKVFTAGKDVLSQTGSAVDLLNGVPSVSVSPAGVASLRGNSNVLVLINGRRSGLTAANALDQLPADQISQVEVITNPSSRYDATGSAGIINIILKKNKTAGFNGQLRLVGGIPNETRITPSINYKSEKLNVFSTVGIRLSDYVGLYTTDQSIRNHSLTSTLNQRQDENRHDNAKLLYVGADYQINDHNTLTAAFLKNATKDHDKTALNYNYASAGPDSSLLRQGESFETRSYNQLEFNYTRTFKNPVKKYTVDMQYDFWDSDKEWNLNTQRTFPALLNLPGIRTGSVGASKDLMVQTDLVQPLDSTSRLEIGLKMENRSVSSNFKAEQQNGNTWSVFENIDNKLAYSELIGAAYAQVRSRLGNFSYQLGLRSELTRIKIEDRVGTYNDRKNYTRLFPTLNLSYRFASNATLQGSYSKRINRPSLNNLYPFNELTDYNSRYVGNPELDPSYAHVFEVGYIKNWNVLTFNPAVYYQRNNGIIVDYTFRNENNVFITSPVNIQREIRKGIELSLLYNPIKWLQLNLEMNAYSFTQQGQYQLQDFSHEGHVLTSRLSGQLKFANKLSIQSRYSFVGGQSNAQTRTLANHNLEFGVSKNLFKDKSTLLFDVGNLFNLRKFKSTTTGADYTLNRMDSPNAARYRLTFVYRLNLKENQAIRQAKAGNRN